jgi:hypothetical protein
MRRVLPHTVALWVALASPAAAAQVEVDRTCHAPGAPVRLTGGGFFADAPYSVWRDEQYLGGGTVDDAGTISASFPAPDDEGRYTVRVFDVLGNRGRTALNVRRPSLELVPAPRDARRVPVRIRVWGLGGGEPPVYLHWVEPGGRVRGPALLGQAAAPCGALETEPRRLLPFRRVARGRWRLQIDTQQRYDPETVPRVVQSLRVMR